MFVLSLCWLCVSSWAAEPIPDRLVVLTFDDSAKSHFTVVRPTLLKYGFGATFFITEGFDFPTNKRDYMTWEEIAQLHADGFEIGNHTRDHLGISDANTDKLSEQLKGIADRCAQHKIPTPITFAWPGNATSTKAFDILKANGIRYARRGGAPEYPYEQGRGFAFEPGKDHPLLLPSAGDARPKWTLDDFIRAAKQAQQGGWPFCSSTAHPIRLTIGSAPNSPTSKLTCITWLRKSTKSLRCAIWKIMKAPPPSPAIRKPSSRLARN